MSTQDQITEKTAQPAAAVPQIAPPAPTPERSSGAIGFLVEVMLMAIIAGFVFIAGTRAKAHWFGDENAAVSLSDSIVTVNFDALVREQIQAMTDLVKAGELEPSEMVERSDVFTKAVMEKVREKGKQGFVVLRSENVLAAPDEVKDLTDQLRTELRSAGVMDQKRDAVK